MKKVQSTELPVEIFNKVYDYFITVSGYKVGQSGNEITIRMLKD